MAGIADTLELRAGPRFELATPRDEPEILRFLARHPLPGPIRLSQEPAAGAALGAGIPHISQRTLIARDAEETIVAAATRRVSRMYINGQPQSVGYLGSLRLDPRVRRKPRFLLNGFATLRELHESAGDCRFYLTSILSDNLTARRFLEKGIPGMPVYRSLAEFVTVVMRVRRCAAGQTGETNRGRIADLLCRNPDQFAPVWSDEELLSDAEFCLRDGACGALWDQNRFRQTVVRGYARRLARWRLIVNAGARILGRPALPRIGEPLRLGFVSRLATATPPQAAGIIAGLHNAARARNMRYLVAGFDARDPRLAVVCRAFGGMQIRGRLYAVYWPDGAAAVDGLDNRIANPEVGTL